MRVPREDLAAALHQQWNSLRTWVNGLQINESTLQNTASALPGWQADHLISHIGMVMATLARIETVGTESPSSLTLAEYFAAQQTNASAEHSAAKEYATGMRGRVRVEVDDLGASALNHMDAILADLGGRDIHVATRHGALPLRSFLAATLIELVTYSDDLGRTFPQAATSPLDRNALKYAAEELLRVVTTRGGWNLRVLDPLLWVRLATGRQSLDLDDLAKAITPYYTSDSIPDLGRILPVI